MLAHVGEIFHLFLIRNLIFFCEMDPKRTISVFPVLENARVHTTTKKRAVFTWECAIGQVSFDMTLAQVSFWPAALEQWDALLEN